MFITVKLSKMLMEFGSSETDTHFTHCPECVVSEQRDFIFRIAGFTLTDSCFKD